MSEKGSGLDIKIILLMVALVVLASAGSGYVSYLIFHGPDREGVATAGGTVRDARTAAEPGPTVDIGQFTVNLAARPGEPVRYLRVQVVAELSNDEGVKELEKRLHQVKDKIIAIFRSKRMDELSAGPGTDAVRRQIAAALNELIYRSRVVDVYFTDFVIQ